MGNRRNVNTFLEDKKQTGKMTGESPRGEFTTAETGGIQGKRRANKHTSVQRAYAAFTLYSQATHL